MNKLDQEMKNWLIECFPNQEEELEELSHNELVNSINRYFDGGLMEFISCSGWSHVDTSVCEVI